MNSTGIAFAQVKMGMETIVPNLKKFLKGLNKIPYIFPLKIKNQIGLELLIYMYKYLKLKKKVKKRKIWVLLN